MSRSAADIADDVAAFLPLDMGAADPLYGGIGAAFALAEAANEDMAAALAIGSAEGKWLELIGRGLGLTRQADETDAAFRTRLRTPPGGVTRPGILEAVNALLASYGADDAIMVEWWEDGYSDYRAYADYVNTIDPYNRFLLIVPLLGDAEGVPAYADYSAYADYLSYADGDFNMAPYLAIVALVNGLKAAGVRWGLYINVDGDFHG